MSRNCLVQTRRAERLMRLVRTFGRRAAALTSAPIPPRPWMPGSSTLSSGRRFDGNKV
jgi:hypothetical protein